MLAKQPPEVLKEKLNRSLRTARPTVVLYNAGDDWVTRQFNGMVYMLPPDGPTIDVYTNEPCVKDGRLLVSDMWGSDQKEITLARQEKRKPRITGIIHDAIAAATHIYLKCEDQGVTVLVGDDESDKLAITEAKRKWVAWKATNASNVLRAYHNSVAQFASNPANSGKPLPAMDERTLGAVRFLDEYNLGLFDSKRIMCPVGCGFHAQDQAIIDRHLQASHPIVAKKSTGGEVSIAAEAELAKLREELAKLHAERAAMKASAAATSGPGNGKTADVSDLPSETEQVATVIEAPTEAEPTIQELLAEQGDRQGPSPLMAPPIAVTPKKVKTRKIGR